MPTTKLFQAFALVLEARATCQKSGNREWAQRWNEKLDALLEQMPSGSGWDRGTKLDPDSTHERLTFVGSFHHMDPHGGYDGWTEHRIVATPSLAHEFSIRVTGQNRNDIKEYLVDLFHEILGSEVEL